MEYICIGKIRNTHGVRGELKIESYSDFDRERYKKGNTVYIEYEGSFLPFRVDTWRMHKGLSLVSFAEHHDINLVEKYKNCLVYIDGADRKPLKQGEFYRDQLAGLKVIGAEGEEAGTVLAVEETLGAQNNLRIETGEKEILIPYVPAFVQEVNPEEGFIRIPRIKEFL